MQKVESIQKDRCLFLRGGAATVDHWAGDNRQGTKREKPSRMGNNHVTCLLLIIKFLVPNSTLQKRPLLKHNKFQADEKLKVSHMFYKVQSYN